MEAEEVEVMEQGILQRKVGAMIADLRAKIEQGVPEEGSFPMVYSEIKITDRKMCLTDILLSFRPKPNHLPNHKAERWLELAGYKLPAPYKSTVIIFKGTTEEAIRYLGQAEAMEKIFRLIPQLDENLRDV